MDSHLNAVYKENSQLSILIERLPNDLAGLNSIWAELGEQYPEVDSAVALNTSLKRKLFLLIDLIFDYFSIIFKIK